MARPKRSKPGVKLFVTTDADVARRLERIATKAGRETGRPVTVVEMHRRGLRSMLAALESCKGCRAGTCDGAHAGPGNCPKYSNSCPDKPDVEDAPIETPAAQAQAPPVVTEPVVVQENMPLVLSPVEPPADKPKRGRPPGVKNGEGRGRKRAAKPREITDESPEHARLVKFYEEQFETVRKEKPAWVPRDFAAFKALRERVGFERACELIRNAFADPFWSKRVTIRKIADDPSMFAGTNSGKTGGPSTMQREDLPVGWS